MTGSLITGYCLLKGPMAQRLAQATHNRLVVGSNPTGPTAFEENSLFFVENRLFFFLDRTGRNVV